MGEPKSPLDAFDELARGKRVRMRFAEPASDDAYRPAEPFETEVEWVHSRRDETEMTITYRAEFTPAEDDPNADVYYVEKRVPEEEDPEVSALMAESIDKGDRTTRRIDAIESVELVD